MTGRRAVHNADDGRLLAVVSDPDSTPAEVAAAREQLVQSHMGLVEYLARRYSDRGESFDDLVQVGSIGLLKAIDRFDPERGANFATYATPNITGEIKRHFRDLGWSVKVPRRLRELGVRLRIERERLTATLGRSPTVDELAAALMVTPEEVLEALDSAQAYSSASLDTPHSEDSQTLADTLGSEDVAISLVVDREALRPALAALEPRERKMLVMRFFGHRSQAEIAEELGISQVHVSRLLTKTLERLRVLMADPE